MKTLKSSSNLIAAILYIVIGILFVAFRAATLNWLMTIVGILFIVYGVLFLIGGFYVEGVIGLIIGILLIIGGWAFVDIILLIFGILAVIYGIYGLVMAINRGDVLGIISNGVMLVVGILLIIARWQLVDWLFIVIGIIFIIDGVLWLIQQLTSKPKASTSKGK